MIKHRGIKWTEEEIEIAKNIYNENGKVVDIIKKIGRSEDAIYKKLKEIGVANRRNLWKREEDKKIISLYQKGLSSTEIYDILKIHTIRSIRDRLIKLGLKKRDTSNWNKAKRKNAWEKGDIVLLKKLVSLGYNGNKISKKLGRSKGAIYNKLRELNLKIAKKTLSEESEYRSYYCYDHNYFKKIDSQKKAYWLGWIASDGTIRYQPEKGVYYLELKISQKDIEVLYELKKDLKSNVQIALQKDRKGRQYLNKISGKKHYIKGQPTCSIRICSKELCEIFIKKYGMNNNKTYSLKYPNISDEFHAGFIAGFISGDGSIDRKRNHGKSRLLRCILVGTIDILGKIASILYKEINYNIHKKISHKKYSKKLYILEMNQTETINMYNWMKQKNIQLMHRKWKLIEEQIEYLNKRLIGPQGQKPTKVVNIKTNEIHHFNSAKEASSFIGVSHSVVCNCIKKSYICKKKYKVSYIKDI